jgi:prophage maintenance system killer protein
MPAQPPPDVQYLDLADYLVLAGAALDVAPEALFDVADLGLAESALHAPAASFAGVEFYPDLVTKAAVLARNGLRFQAADVDATVDMMVKIAGSEVEQAEVEDWVRRQTG